MNGKNKTTVETRFHFENANMWYTIQLDITTLVWKKITHLCTIMIHKYIYIYITHVATSSRLKLSFGKSLTIVLEHNRRPRWGLTKRVKMTLGRRSGNIEIYTVFHWSRRRSIPFVYHLQSVGGSLCWSISVLLIRSIDFQVVVVVVWTILLVHSITYKIRNNSL